MLHSVTPYGLVFQLSKAYHSYQHLSRPYHTNFCKIVCVRYYHGMTKYIYALAVVTILLLVPTHDAHAIEKDHDGHVPIHYVYDCQHAYMGRAIFSYRNGHAQNRIRINVCYLQRINATYRMYVYTLRHEWAHAHDGLDHYDLSPSRNPAYYPYYR